MKRTANGQFPKGASGNPRGRPKVGQSMAELAREYGPEMLMVLVAAGRKGSLAAAQAVLDRGFGKPAQSVDMKLLLNKRINELSAAELAALEQQLVELGADQEHEESGQ
jgi:hypothetical protein